MNLYTNSELRMVSIIVIMIIMTILFEYSKSIREIIFKNISALLKIKLLLIENKLLLVDYNYFFLFRAYFRRHTIIVTVQ